MPVPPTTRRPLARPQRISPTRCKKGSARSPRVIATTALLTCLAGYFAACALPGRPYTTVPTKPETTCQVTLEARQYSRGVLELEIGSEHCQGPLDLLVGEDDDLVPLKRFDAPKDTERVRVEVLNANEHFVALQGEHLAELHFQRPVTTPAPPSTIDARAVGRHVVVTWDDAGADGYLLRLAKLGAEEAQLLDLPPDTEHAVAVPKGVYSVSVATWITRNDVKIAGPFSVEAVVVVNAD